MLAVARRRFGDRVELVEASATDLPSRTPRSTTSRSPTCCGTSTTPARRSPSSPASCAPAARSPTSSSASPAGSGARSGSSTSASACRPPGGLISRGWYDVGRFLGPSIRGFYEQWPLERQLELWQRGRDRGRAGATHEPRRRRRDLGHAREQAADEAGVLRPAAGRLARLRDAAAPAVHGLAPLLRRRRRLPRGRGARGAGWG